MPDISRLAPPRPASRAASELPPAFRAEVRSTPADASEAIYVNIPALDPDNRGLLWGPCPWEPRILDDANFGIPSRGDQCLVLMDDEGEPWVVSWWPYG